jgi:hypothetical protein
MTEKIPVIYASIGDRSDINVNPSRTEVVASVFDSANAREYRRGVFSSSRDVRDDYINQLEVALLEAISPQFLAERLREIAEDQNIVSPTLAGDIKKIANKISPKSM